MLVYVRTYYIKKYPHRWNRLIKTLKKMKTMI